jgi:hypothetical protein
MSKGGKHKQEQEREAEILNKRRELKPQVFNIPKMAGQLDISNIVDRNMSIASLVFIIDVWSGIGWMCVLCSPYV